MIVLLITSTVTLIKGINLHQKESIKLHQEEISIHTSDRNPLLSSQTNSESKVFLDNTRAEDLIVPSSSTAAAAAPSENVESSTLPIYPDGNEDGIGGGEGAGFNGVADPDMNSTPIISDLYHSDNELKMPYIPILVVLLSWLVSGELPYPYSKLYDFVYVDIRTILRTYE